MDKISAHGNLYLLLPVIFLAMSSMIGAVDIIMYSNPNACDGNGYIFSGITEGYCCYSRNAQGSVLFRYMDDCKGSVAFSEGFCSGNAANSGVGDGCLVGGRFTSANWFQFERCSRHSLLADNDVAFDTVKCKGVGEPTGIVFTENVKNGTWLLTTPNAVELYSQLETLPRAEKANWLQSEGATFDTSLEQ